MNPSLMATEPRFSPAALARAVLALTIATALAVALGIALGERPLSLSTAFADPASLDRGILVALRLPRALLGMLVGAALAVSGAALQALLQNPLADPFVLGVSGGAALGGAAAIALGLDRLPQVLAPLADTMPAVLAAAMRGLASLSPVALFAFGGALAATAVVFGAGRVGGRVTPYGALLAGVVFNAFAAAAITCLKSLTSPERLGALLYWLAGALTYPGYGTLLALALLVFGATAALVHDAHALNLLSQGEENALALGVDVPRVRRRLFMAASLAVASAVALTGLIGFVGLLVPQLLRLWLGPDQRLLLPASALGGAAFLVLADLGVRLLFPVLGAEAPVGVLTALLGGPAFLILLRRRGAELAG
ncbi:MAG: iron ABC transporter permease [Deltaproteobacteria bacterium]|nr:iron ABC transporter permease [Deltaproteobacteria bacterium]